MLRIEMDGFAVGGFSLPGKGRFLGRRGNGGQPCRDEEQNAWK